MDPLESFIAKNREAFDAEQPREVLWEVISDTLNRTPDLAWRRRHKAIIRRKRFAVAAAAAIGLLAIGAGLGWFMRVQVASETILAHIHPPSAETELFFHQAINIKLAEVHEAGLSVEVLPDVNQLEHQMEKLKTAFDEALPAQREYIIHAMIRNYQLRIELLETVLQERKQENSQQTPQHHEGTTTL